ncbi:hypothetical protein F4780DRAFT_498142 [Xylariomycetidae sp. FL0641]|nr:hypothetical protein F4780DRAFT_498142 [Xylariomycetidae sp. FL0641]
MEAPTSRSSAAHVSASSPCWTLRLYLACLAVIKDRIEPFARPSRIISTSYFWVHRASVPVASFSSTITGKESLLGSPNPPKAPKCCDGASFSNAVRDRPPHQLRSASSLTSRPAFTALQPYPCPCPCPCSALLFARDLVPDTSPVPGGWIALPAWLPGAFSKSLCLPINSFSLCILLLLGKTMPADFVLSNHTDGFQPALGQFSESATTIPLSLELIFPAHSPITTLPSPHL